MSDIKIQVRSRERPNTNLINFHINAKLDDLKHLIDVGLEIYLHGKWVSSMDELNKILKLKAFW